MFVYNGLKDIGLNRFTEKLALYNNYAGNYLNEPSEENITKKTLYLQRFQIFGMKDQQQPFQMYLKKLKKNRLCMMERNNEHPSFLENCRIDGETGETAEKQEFKKSKSENSYTKYIFF